MHAFALFMFTWSFSLLSCIYVVLTCASQSHSKLNFVHGKFCTNILENCQYVCLGHGWPVTFCSWLCSHSWGTARCSLSWSSSPPPSHSSRESGRRNSYPSQRQHSPPPSAGGSSLLAPAPPRRTLKIKNGNKQKNFFKIQLYLQLSLNTERPLWVLSQSVHLHLDLYLFQS